MLDEEGRTRLKLKVCLSAWMSLFVWACLFTLKCYYSIFLSAFSNAVCLVSGRRWKIQFGGEPKRMRREMKCERATHVLWNGLMAGVCCQLDCMYNVNKKVIFLFWFTFLLLACPSIWGMKCLTFTKHLCKETTTTCSYDRVLACRDKLSSKPNSPSGNAGNYIFKCFRLFLFSVNNNGSFDLLCFKSVSFLAPASPPGCSAFSDHMSRSGHQPKLLCTQQNSLHPDGIFVPVQRYQSGLLMRIKTQSA